MVNVFFDVFRCSNALLLLQHWEVCCVIIDVDV